MQDDKDSVVKCKSASSVLYDAGEIKQLSKVLGAICLVAAAIMLAAGGWALMTGFGGEQGAYFLMTLALFCAIALNHMRSISAGFYRKAQLYVASVWLSEPQGPDVYGFGLSLPIGVMVVTSLAIAVWCSSLGYSLYGVVIVLVTAIPTAMTFFIVGLLSSARGALDMHHSILRERAECEGGVSHG